MNKTILVGRLTKDPELKYTPQGTAVASFTVAVNRPFKDQNGQSQADFINCVAWRSQAEFLANYTRKGYLIALSGSIQTRNYQDQNGKTVYVTEVVADQVQNLEPKKEQPAPAKGFDPNDIPNPYDFGDDLPF